MKRMLTVFVLTTMVTAPTWAAADAKKASGDDASVASFNEAKQHVEALRGDAQRKQFRHHYGNLVIELKAVVKKTPRGSKADDAAYVAAQVLEEMSEVSRIEVDRRLAVDAYVWMADHYSSSNLVDDALVAAAKLTADDAEAVELASRVVAMGKRADMLGGAQAVLAKRSAGAARAIVATNAKLSHDGHHHDEPETKTPPAVTTKAATGLTAVEVLPERPPAGTPSRKVMVIRHERTATDSLVQLDVSGPVGVTRGDAPPDESRGRGKRIYFDIAPAKLGQRNVQPIEVHDGTVIRVRAGQYEPDVVRLVVELEGDSEPSLVVTRKPFRVILQSPLPKVDVVAGQRPAVAVMPAAKVVAAAPAPITDNKPSLSTSAQEVKTRLADGAPGGVSISQQLGLQVRRVVIDAGHGGNDTGAIGPTGVKEKDITLQIAKRVRDKLNSALPNLEVIMTRDDDRTLALQDRTNTANLAAADLFISIHCNASPSRRVRGVETYYLNVTHDRYAMRLAARENAESNDGSISDLDYILADLAMKSNVDDSVRLGKSVQRQVMKRLQTRWNDVPDLGLKHALFYVLMGNHMPSVLVETSFLSNKIEEQRLSSDLYQDSVADGVVDGVRAFIDERQSFFAGTP